MKCYQKRYWTTEEKRQWQEQEKQPDNLLRFKVGDRVISRGGYSGTIRYVQVGTQILAYGYSVKFDDGDYLFISDSDLMKYDDESESLKVTPKSKKEQSRKVEQMTLF